MSSRADGVLRPLAVIWKSCGDWRSRDLTTWISSKAARPKLPPPPRALWSVQGGEIRYELAHAVVQLGVQVLADPREERERRLVLRQHDRAEALDPELASPFGERQPDLRAEPTAVQMVGDHDPDLCCQRIFAAA